MKTIKRLMAFLLVAVILLGYVPVARAEDPVTEVRNAIYKMLDPLSITYENRDMERKKPDTGYDAVLAKYNQLTSEEKKGVDNVDKLKKWIEAYYDVGYLKDLKADDLQDFKISPIGTYDEFNDKAKEFDEFYYEYNKLSADGRNRSEAKSAFSTYEERKKYKESVEKEVDEFIDRYKSEEGNKIYLKHVSDVLLTDEKKVRDYIAAFNTSDRIKQSAMVILKEHYKAFDPDPNDMVEEIERLKKSASVSEAESFTRLVEERLQTASDHNYPNPSNPAKPPLSNYLQIIHLFEEMKRAGVVVGTEEGGYRLEENHKDIGAYFPDFQSNFNDNWEGMFNELMEKYEKLDYKEVANKNVIARKKDMDKAFRYCLIVAYHNRIEDYEEARDRIRDKILETDPKDPDKVDGLHKAYLSEVEVDKNVKAFMTDEYVKIKEMMASVDGFSQADSFKSDTENLYRMSEDDPEIIQEKTIIIDKLKVWKTSLNLGAKEYVEDYKNKLLILLKKIELLEREAWEYKFDHAKILYIQPDDLVYEFHKDGVKKALEAYNRIDTRLKPTLIDEKNLLDDLVKRMYELEAENFLNSYIITRESPMPAEWDTSEEEARAKEALGAFSRLENEVKDILREDSKATEFKNNLDKTISNLLEDSRKFKRENTELVYYNGSNISVIGMKKNDRDKLDREIKEAYHIVFKAEGLVKSIKTNFPNLTIADEGKIADYKANLNALSRALTGEGLAQSVAESAMKYAEKHSKILEFIDKPNDAGMRYNGIGASDPGQDNWEMVETAIAEFNKLSDEIKNKLASGVTYTGPDNIKNSRENIIINDVKLKDIRESVDEKINKEKAEFKIKFDTLYDLNTVGYGRGGDVEGKLKEIKALDDRSKDYIEELISRLRLDANYSGFELFRDDANNYLKKLVDLEYEVIDKKINSPDFKVLDNVGMLMDLKTKYGDIDQVKDAKMRSRVDDALGVLDRVMRDIPEAIRRLLEAFERDYADLLSGRPEVTVIKNYDRTKTALEEIEKIMGYMEDLKDEDALKDRGKTIKGKLDNLMKAINEKVNEEAKKFLAKNTDLIDSFIPNPVDKSLELKEKKEKIKEMIESRKLPNSMDPMERKEIYEEYKYLAMDGTQDEDRIINNKENIVLERAMELDSRYYEGLFGDIEECLNEWIKGNDDYQGKMPPDVKDKLYEAELFIPKKNRAHDMYEWTIRFNQELDRTTISNVEVYDSGDWKIHDISTRLTNDGKGIIIRPNKPYKSDIRYYILIPDTILSRDGKRLKFPLKMIFRAY